MLFLLGIKHVYLIDPKQFLFFIAALGPDTLEKTRINLSHGRGAANLILSLGAIQQSKPSPSWFSDRAVLNNDHNS